MENFSWKKYVLAFLITASLFGTSFYASNRISEKKLASLETMADTIAIDILSSEAQFALLAEASCKNLHPNSTLSQELNSLARRLDSAEAQLGTNDPEVIRLKRYYSILQIKDYLLMKQISAKCDREPTSILYFYTNDGTCKECSKQGLVLTRMRDDHPELRVYAFDANIDLAAMDTLKSLYEVTDQFPALVIHETPYSGFQTQSTLENLLPELTATSTATSTEEEMTDES